MTTDYTCQCPGPFGAARYTVVEAARMMFQCQRCKSQLVPAEPIKMVESRRFENDVDDDSAPQVAPGANEGDDPIQALLKREDEIKRRREAGEFDGATGQTKNESRRERKAREEREKSRQTALEAAAAAEIAEEKSDDKPPTVNDIRESIDLPRIPIADIPAHPVPPMTLTEAFKAIGDGWRKLVGDVPMDEAVELVRDVTEPDVRIQYAHGVVYEFQFDEFEEGWYIERLLEFAESWKSRKNAILDIRARGRRYLLNAELVAGIDFRD